MNARTPDFGLEMGMFPQNFIYHLPQVASAVILLFVAGIILFNASAKQYSRPFAFLLIVVALHTIGVMAGNLAKTVPQQIVIHTAAATIIIFGTPAWIVFITSYSGFGRWLTPSVRWCVWGVSTLFAIIMACNRWLGWVFCVEYVSNDPALTIRSYAPFAYVLMGYTLIAMFYGMILFWFAISKSQGVFRKQFLFMMLGAVLLVMSIVVTFFLVPASDLSIIVRPILSFFAGIAFLLGIYLSQLFDIVPISRRTFFEQVQTGFVACDEAGRIIDANPAAINLLHQPLNNLIGQDCKEAFTIFSKPLDHKLFTASQRMHNEHQIKSNNGASPQWFNVEAAPIHAQGQRCGTSLILRDITREKESKTLRETLNRMIYHDLSQPIEAIMFSAALAKYAYETKNDEEQEQYLTSVEDASNRLLNMMRTLQTLNRSKMQSLQLNLMKHDLNNLIIQTVEMYTAKAQSEQITLAQQTPDTPTLIPVDVELILRVLDNLVSNGMRFTPENGRILIKLTLQPDTITVSVIDNGIGLQTDTPDQLFKEGVSIGTMQRSGLGLAFCRMVVEAHNGRIQFDPVPTGTSVTFTLPII